MIVRLLSLLLVYAFCLPSYTASAQINECGTDEYNQQLRMQFPERLQQREQIQAQIRHYLSNKNNNGPEAQKSSVRLIPVVVHLITETGAGGLTKQEIEQGIELMNQDFRRLNSDTSLVRQEFKNLVADSEIEFRLAKIDPLGNCTEGIVRIASPLTNNAVPHNAVKDLSYWPADKYFNIWLVNSASVAGAGAVNGYAQYPATGPLNTFGVVCRIDRFGLNYTNGIRTRTLTHEVGHCLNLYHLHDFGCGSDCQFTGDEVCDTPPSDAGFFTCSTSLNSCSNDTQGPSAFTSNVNDQFENYMAYGDCRLMYTHGQKARMLASLDFYQELQNLATPANAIATGIASPATQTCAPVAAFSASKTEICAGSSINFTDHSYNAIVDSSWTWNWSFPGGVPSASTSQNQLVQYTTPGIHPVTLTVSNAAGTDMLTKTSYIKVWSATGEIAPYVQSFEDPAFPAHATNPEKDWLIEASTTNTWTRTTNAAAGGAAAVSINNKFISNGSANSLISPALDLSSLTSASLRFDVAYSQAFNLSDQLKVYVSYDCGDNWVIRYAKAGSILSTTGTQQIPNFMPSQPSQWRTETVSINSINSLSNVRIKFEATSGLGNSIYLDNINLSTISGTEELTAQAIGLFPNPAEEKVMLQIDLPKASQISYRFTDVTGREIMAASMGRMEKGSLEIPVSLAGISAGVYVVQVSDGTAVVTHKLVIQ